MPRAQLILPTLALVVAAVLALLPPTSQSARLAGRASGPGTAALGCAGRWAPIQAKVSGFVVGNCRGGTRVRGIANDACAPGCVRGVASEGGGWAAVSLPRSQHYQGCGWINVKNRLHDRRPAGMPRNHCRSIHGPDIALPQTYMKRYSGRRVGRALRPSTTKYAGLYVWGGRFTSGPNIGQEAGAVSYRPRFPADPKGICRAYANINPSIPGQQVRRSERMWKVHDGSRHLQIRYMARFQVKDEKGRLRWWVNAHSTYPGDRDQPWGFVAAECIFQGETERERIFARPAQPAIAAPWLAFPPLPAVAPQGKCGLRPVAFHLISARRGLSCAAAKRVLRRLGTGRSVVPMSCRRPFTAGGWRVRNVLLDPSIVISHYSKAGRSFEYQRHRFPNDALCRWG